MTNTYWYIEPDSTDTNNNIYKGSMLNPEEVQEITDKDGNSFQVVEVSSLHFIKVLASDPANKFRVWKKVGQGVPSLAPPFVYGRGKKPISQKNPKKKQQELQV